MTHAQYRLSAGEPCGWSSTTRFDDEWNQCCITIARESATGRAAGWYVPALGAGSDAGICCDEEYRGASRAPGRHDRGSITVGKRADLILVEGDLIARICDICKVALVLRLATSTTRRRFTRL